MSCYEGSYPCTVHEYALTGRQVEPDASYWNHCPQLRVISVEELIEITDDPSNPAYFPPYPDPCTPAGETIIKQEMEELLELQKLRDDPCKLENPGHGCPVLTDAPCKPLHKLPNAFGCRAPVSKLLNLQPFALGAAMVDRFPGNQIVRTGRGMARMIEAETPGLYHRHALNYLMHTRGFWSPPRQALVWAALDVALASALEAAWYYKWLSARPLVSRRERPIEYAKRNNLPLNVLFDHPDELNPMYSTCPDARPCAPHPGFSPGTPRHPAYPSGHSTYSGAASTILAYFFGNDQTPDFLRLSAPATVIGEEVRRMADNIGLGRMWAGIHWRSDHEAGLKLGQVVACLVLRQLAGICGGDFDMCPTGPKPVKQCTCEDGGAGCPADPPTPCGDLKKRAKLCRDKCADDPEIDPKPCPAYP
ncbi:MAG TPA: vanadium-dependent haloperoxidase [Candidatus Elarobacter sp.]|nr:vanadium-dependent haloperoxidase [Candidatus Elarobacter sp.]